MADLDPDHPLKTPRSAQAIALAMGAIGYGATVSPHEFIPLIISACYVSAAATTWLCRVEICAVWRLIRGEKGMVKIPHDFWVVAAMTIIVVATGTILLFHKAEASPSPPISNNNGGVSIGHDNKGNICTSGATCTFSQSAPKSRPQIPLAPCPKEGTVAAANGSDNNLSDNIGGNDSPAVSLCNEHRDTAQHNRPGN